jgi:hypothetical protein
MQRSPWPTCAACHHRSYASANAWTNWSNASPTSSTGPAEAKQLRRVHPAGSVVPGVLLAFFWLYNIIDAGRRASLLNQALAGDAPIELPSELKLPSFGGSIGGGLLLIVAGGVLLSHTKWGYSLDWIAEWWPVGPMLFGAWLLVRAILDRTR